ncbi:MAG: hypothetical protein F4210_05360 [Holophagales bacterium]|nr:hypothetical protein [Holophagales bacterium]MYF94930.1 hypothetical protein [Holophagales bacterium]
MGSRELALDEEVAAIQGTVEALTPLEPDSRERVLRYVTARFGISTPRQSPTVPERRDDDVAASDDTSASSAPSSFETLAELFDAAQPSDNPDKALVAAYWVQTSGEADSFESASANRELKNLGHRIANITDAINVLKRRNPAPVVQLRKSGKTRQARKTYKVTDAGVRAVEEMIRG